VTVKAEIYQADAFTQRREKLLTSLETEYRFQKGDELFIEEGERPQKMRVIFVQVRIKGGELQQEILALRI
jgi:hypothetical protein